MDEGGRQGRGGGVHVHYCAFFCIMFWFNPVQSSSVFCVSWTSLLTKNHLHKFPLLKLICRTMK